MVKKCIFKYIIYAAAFAALTLAEKTLGIYGLAIGFLFATSFCRERYYVVLPCFFAAQTLIPFSLNAVIYASAAAALFALAYFIHYKVKLKRTFVESAILTALSLAPYVGLNVSGDFAWLRIVLSLSAALTFGYASAIAAYPVVIRGLRYKLTCGEIFCIGIVVCVASIGLGSFELFNVKPYFFIVAFAAVFLKGTGSVAVLPFGAASGLGMAIGSGNPVTLCAVTVASLVAAGSGRYKTVLSGIVTGVAFALTALFFNGKFDIYSAVPFFAGGLAASCIPPKIYKRTGLTRRGYVGRYAMRTVVNRDREELSEKLNYVSSAFYEMRDILTEEQVCSPDIGAVTDSVCSNVCAECNFCGKCVEKFDIRASINKLTEAGVTNGKCTLLDVSVLMGENCRKVSYVINAVNDGVATYKRILEKRSGIEQGRDMLITQTGGAAALIGEMAKSVKTGLTFDVEKEKLLLEKLGQANVIAADAMIYDADTAKAEVTAVVREKDVKKPALREIVSEVIGMKMTEYSQKTAINGMVGVSFCKAPEYGIMYGETVSSKEERCGDTRQAVKIGKNKLMFVLSDGMGTGKNAHFTAGCVTRLIEAFYKAGFDHGTIFTCVAGLMSLRTQEDFSALDVLVADVSTGDVDFIKQGGRESYIVSQERFERIEGGSLPMGIIADSSPKIERRRLRTDETVILMSDGVADALSADEIREIAVGSGLRNPKTVSDEVVAAAKLRKGEGYDDMTVMALRLVRTNEKK